MVRVVITDTATDEEKQNFITDCLVGTYHSMDDAEDASIGLCIIMNSNMKTVFNTFRANIKLLYKAWRGIRKKTKAERKIALLDKVGGKQ